MGANKTDAGNIKRVGGRLCLDFMNTVPGRGGADLGEYFNRYQDLVAWSRHVGTITHREAKTLSLIATQLPPEAKAAHGRAIELREIIYGIFSCIVEGESPTEKDLKAFNDYLSRTMRQSRIIKTKDGLFWDSNGDKKQLDWILNPIVRSAADLLVSDETKKIKSCSDPKCGWLFLDISRNQSRRWCDMKDCGNRAKASRFYKKKQMTKRYRAVGKGL